jgi:O-antigen biosynthesis protein
MNSRAWWEQFFEHNWDANHGSAQTAHFMDRLLAGLARLGREFEYLSTRSLDVLDWGCAFGEGAQRLSEAFPQCHVTGLDFAEGAVATARRRYPTLEFLHMEGGRLPRDFDVIVTSNCLEHFDDPLAIAREHLRSCRKLYIALVPYREEPLSVYHAVRFDDDTFPVRLGGFIRVAAETIRVDPVFWNGLQILVVYASLEYLAEVNLLSDATASVDAAHWAERVEQLRIERDRQATAHAAREAELVARLDERGRLVEELTARLNELATGHAHDREQERYAREEIQERVVALQREVDDLMSVTHAQAQQLAEIMSGLSWKVMQGTWWLRRKLAPPGSLPARAARLGLRVARKAGQGPGPLARAVIKATYRHLPERVRRRVQTRLQRPTHRPPPPALDAPPSFGMPGLVSVILPVFNQADLLPSSVESVLKQTYPDFELVIVNDGSSDGVERVLAEFAGHSRIRILTQVNQKLPKALSNGFDFARGEFWTWTSADNLMHPEQLARQVAFLRANPAAAMVYADYLAINDRGEPLREPDWRPHNRRTPDAHEIHLPRSTEALNTVHDNFIGPCFLYRGWVGRVIGEYDPNLGNEDYDYWMRLNDLFRIEHMGCDEPLYSYRVHDNSLSGRAVELRIVEKGRKLLEYDKDRAAYYRAPWTVIVDRAVAGQLAGVATAPHRVVTWDGGPLPVVEGKALALVGPASLPALAELERPEGMPTAAWFGVEAEAPYESRLALRTLRAAAFALDTMTAGRLAALNVESFQAGRPGDVFGLALRWANGRSYYEATRPEAVRRREPPRVFVPVGRRLRVVVQVDDFTQGGLEQIALGLATSLDPRRFQVVLLVLGQQGDAVRRARAAGVRVVTLPETDRAEHYRRFLVDERIDLVNAHFSLFGADVAAGLEIPFVQVVQNTYVWLSPEEVEAHRQADRHTSCYVCVSDEVVRYCDIRLGLSIAKMVVVPNGVPVRRFEAAAARCESDDLRTTLGLERDDFVFLNVASIHATKAQVPAALALGQVVATHPRARLVFLGRAIEPAYLAELQTHVKRLGLDGSVVIAGQTVDPAPYYRMADAFLLPSYWEGWSLALNEALAAGLPVVATDVGAARDLVTAELGRLIRPPFGTITELDWWTHLPMVQRHDPRFVAALADAMRAVCDRPARVTLPGPLRARIDQDRIHEQYANLFAWLVQGGRPEAARTWCRPPGGVAVSAARVAGNASAA